MKVAKGKRIGLDAAMNLDPFEKTQLIRNDPVTCARYFDYKISKFLNYTKSENGPFEEHRVKDVYERVEFQIRGSPHEHIFIWLSDSPQYVVSEKETLQECINFVDRFITCQYEEDNPLIEKQRHKHTITCTKGRKNKVCRFHYPLPVMPSTRILETIPDSEKTEQMGKDLVKIREQMNCFFKNN